MQSLTKELQARLKGAKRIAVLGVGSEFRADDAAGMLVAENIHKKSKNNRLKVFLGATAPENLTGEIKRYKPTHLIVVDTADLKEKPGAVLLLETEDLGEGVSFSTHKLPAKVMMDYFIQSIKCRIIFIGIQPKNISFGKPASKEVKASVKGVSSAIIDAVKDKA
ncbi:MAG: hydrogenase maturation peptidase HycI [Candidatus Omnitrophota bacterium]|nr:hydrogenase maturation peptidase HycI [Candidatus Omnitrophota bacterium]